MNAAFAFALVLALAPVHARAAATAPHQITYDRHSLSIDGKRIYVWSGDFHYWRLPSPDLWRDVLEKMHAAGYNAVSIYFDWAYHSAAPGSYDFSGVRDVEKLLDIAADVGIYVIARPGPYINAETDSGGFPGWLQSQKAKARTSDPEYLGAAEEWLSQIDPILARHQLTNGTGTIILYQVENEYTGKSVDRAYMSELERKVRADGITVPLVHNSCCGDGGRWASGAGAVDINGYDSYPQGFNCERPERWQSLPDDEFSDTRKRLGNQPFFLLEFQGGSFDPWGGPGYDLCRKLTDASFERVFDEYNIAAGASLQNFYMMYGGTSWGWLPSPEAVYSSYDYGAAIDESRGLGEKYDTQKLLANEVATLTPALTSSVTVHSPNVSNPGLHVDARFDPSTKTTFYIARHADVDSTSRMQASFAASINGRQYNIPVELSGRDSKIIVANFRLGTLPLVYSTSEIMANRKVGERNIAALFGRAGENGEMVFAFPSRPRILAPAGVEHSWNEKTKTLRLNYRHGELSRVFVRPNERGAHCLELLIGSDQAAADLWPWDTSTGSVIVRGPELIRRVTAPSNDTLALTGDTAATTELEVIAPSRITSLTWNGDAIAVRRSSDGTLVATLPGPQRVTVPALTTWRMKSGSPESDPGFDDSRWTVADRTLYADDYGFHYGDVWFRGSFDSSDAHSIAISAITGKAGAYAVWLNGTYLGYKQAADDGRAKETFSIDPGTLRKKNTLAVLLENNGHNEDFSHRDSHKEPRGIVSVSFADATPSIAWRIQGKIDHDPVRGPMNAGGQFGERMGFYLPEFSDTSWPATSLPSTHLDSGITWYRTNFELHVPADQDAAIALQIDDSKSKAYRALIYLNGWLVGRYVNDIGPQQSFILPDGILHTDGSNTLAISCWNLDPKQPCINAPYLKLLRNVRSSLRVTPVLDPSYAQVFGK